MPPGAFATGEEMTVLRAFCPDHAHFHIGSLEFRGIDSTAVECNPTVLAENQGLLDLTGQGPFL